MTTHQAVAMIELLQQILAELVVARKAREVEYHTGRLAAANIKAREASR